MDSNLLTVLLRESESTSLDFKRDQYRFGTGASENDKSELLKDILAFANSWRHADAFILVGVDEANANAIVGVSTHFDDANLQQFVNSKTHRPLTFSYETVTYNGKQIDIFKIPMQERPQYLKKDFGQLKKNTVYIRRGSSTDIASPAEVAEIGRASISTPKTPTLKLEFVDPATSQSLGTSIRVAPMIVNYESEKIPTYSSNRGLFGRIAFNENANYYRERAAYIRTIEFFKLFKLRAVSTSAELAEDVALVLNVDQANVKFSSDKRSPFKPVRTSINYNFRPVNYKTAYGVTKTANGVSLNVHFGNIRPKANSDPPGYFSVGSHVPAKFPMKGHFYGNNIAEPIPVELSLELDVQHRNLDLDELDE